MTNHDEELKAILNKANQYLSYFHLTYTMVKDSNLRLTLLDNITEYIAILEQDYANYSASLGLEAEEITFLENIDNYLQERNITNTQAAIAMINGLQYQLGDNINNAQVIEELKTQIKSSIEIFSTQPEEKYITLSNTTKIDAKLLELKAAPIKDDIINELQNIANKITCLLKVINEAENISATDNLLNSLESFYQNYDLCMRAHTPMLLDLMLYRTFFHHTVGAFTQIKSLMLTLAESTNIADANDYEFIFNQSAEILDRQIGIKLQDYGYSFLLKYDEESLDFVEVEKLELINLITNTMLIEGIATYDIRLLERSVEPREHEVGIMQHANNKLLIKINYLEMPMLGFILTKEQHPAGISQNLYRKLSHALAKHTIFDEQPLIFTKQMIPVRLYVKIKEQMLELTQEAKLTQELLVEIKQAILTGQNLDFLDLTAQTAIIDFIQSKGIATTGIYLAVKDKPALELPQESMLYQKIKDALSNKQDLTLSAQEKLEIINFTYQHQLTGIFSRTQETIATADQIACMDELFDITQQIISLAQFSTIEQCQEIMTLNAQGKNKANNPALTSYTPMTKGLFQMFIEVDQMRKAAIEMCEANNEIKASLAEIATNNTISYEVDVLGQGVGVFDL